MTTLLEKTGKKLFERHLEQYSPADPLYETYTNAKGKQKRKKRALPPGLSERDAKILQSVKRRAHYLDKGFTICGLRFGWTFIIGLIPGAGDVADATLNYVLVLRKSRQADIPPWLVRHMLLNNLVSAGVGFVPIAGDVFLGMFKANSRNAALLEEFLRIRGEEFLKLQAQRKEVRTVDGASGSTSGQAVVVTEQGSTNPIQGKIGKSGKVEVAQGVTKSDVEQLKPGAGREQGEIIPPNKSNGIKKGFSWMGGRKSKGTDNTGKNDVALGAIQERGRFVEGS